MEDEGMTGTLPVRWVHGDGREGDPGKGGGDARGDAVTVAGPELVARWIKVQLDSMREAQRIQDLAWQQRRIGHPSIQRVINVRWRRNIKLVLPLIGEDVFYVPPLWAVTEGDVLIGYTLVEEL